MTIPPLGPEATRTEPVSAAGANANGQELKQLQQARDAALFAARAAVRDTTRLTRLLAILGEPGPLHDLLDRALTTLSELFAADVLALFDPIGAGSFRPMASVGLPESMAQEPFSSTPEGLIRRLMREKRPLVLDTVEASPSTDHQFLELGVCTLVGLPVAGYHSIRGALMLARCRPEAFTDPEVHLLATMAYRIGLALEEAQRSAQLEQITQSSRIIGSHLDAQAITQEVVRIFPDIVQAEAAALVLSHPGGTLYCAASAGLPVSCNAALVRLGAHCLSQGRFHSGEPYLAEDMTLCGAGPGVQPLLDLALAGFMAIPLRRKEVTEGVLLALRREALGFNPITVQMGLLYVGQLAAALENALLYAAAHNELAERLKAVQALRASDDRFRALIRSVSDIIAILSLDGVMHYLSPAAETFWRCPEISLCGQNILSYMAMADQDTMLSLLVQADTRPGGMVKGKVFLNNAEGQRHSFEVTLVNLQNDLTIQGFVATFHDVTERTRYEHELTRLAYRDPLTDLANRAHFLERLQQAVHRARETSLRLAVIFFDLDNFKSINDTLGHASGDQALCEVADRVRACLRKDDIAARLGGDEFTILIEALENDDQALPMVHRLMTMLRQPILLQAREFLVGGSIGIAVGSGEENEDEMLRRADLAMYRAKSSGKGCFVVYAPTMESA